MKVLYTIFIIGLLLYLIWEFGTRKYLNPYKLYVLFGPKGVGKSTLLQKLVRYYKKRGYTCYCNVGDCDSPDVKQILIEDLPRLAEAGHRIYHYNDDKLAKEIRDDYLKRGITYPSAVKPHSIIFHDEINLMYDNRNFKEFAKDTQKYFRLQRHYKHIYIGFSQTFDCDKKIRDLADVILLCSKKARIFISCKAYYKKPVIISPNENNSRENATATDDFIPMGLLYDMFSPFRAFLPYWCKKHDSYK